MNNPQATHVYKAVLYNQYSEALAKEQETSGKYTVGIKADGKLSLVATWLVPIVRLFSFLHTIKFDQKITKALIDYKASPENRQTLTQIKSHIENFRTMGMEPFPESTIDKDFESPLKAPHFANKSIDRLLQSFNADITNIAAEKKEQTRKDNIKLRQYAKTDRAAAKKGPAYLLQVRKARCKRLLQDGLTIQQISKFTIYYSDVEENLIPEAEAEGKVTFQAATTSKPKAPSTTKRIMKARRRNWNARTQAKLEAQAAAKTNTTSGAKNGTN